MIVKGKITRRILVEKHLCKIGRVVYFRYAGNGSGYADRCMISRIEKDRIELAVIDSKNDVVLGSAFDLDFNSNLVAHKIDKEKYKHMHGKPL